MLEMGGKTRDNPRSCLLLWTWWEEVRAKKTYEAQRSSEELVMD